MDTMYVPHVTAGTTSLPNPHSLAFSIDGLQCSLHADVLTLLGEDAELLAVREDLARRPMQHERTPAHAQQARTRETDGALADDPTLVRVS